MQQSNDVTGQEEDANQNLKLASWAFGISYALLFATGLGQQCIVNFNNKSTKGYSTDYCLIGLTGFTFLFVNQSIGVYDVNSDAGRIRATDMAFAASAFFCGLFAYV